MNFLAYFSSQTPKEGKLLPENPSIWQRLSRKAPKELLSVDIESYRLTLAQQLETQCRQLQPQKLM